MDPNEQQTPDTSELQATTEPADAANEPNRSADETGSNRRNFLSTATSVAMTGGLVAGYGSFAAIALRFLYNDAKLTEWQYVARVDQLKKGGSMTYVAPAGTSVVIARRGSGTTPGDFLALSSVCPHLGCQVHWEPQNKQFFCPCHNGAFDAEGKATKGPPAQVRPPQELKRFPLRIEEGLIYIEVPVKSVAREEVVVAKPDDHQSVDDDRESEDVKEA